MCFNRQVSLIISAVFFLSVEANLPSIDDVRKYNLRCNARTCTNPPKQFRPYNCKCDADCLSFGDCCLDAPHFNLTTQVHNARKSECMSLNPRDNVYTESTCKADWENSQIARLCAAASPSNVYSQKDPLLSFPVTNLITSVTYSNYYCAVCNNDTENLHTWEGLMKCEIYSKDWATVLDFFHWERYNLEYRNVLMNNGNITEFLDIYVPTLYKQLSGSEVVQDYINSNLVYLENANSWVLFIKHNSREIKMECGISLQKNQKSRDCISTVHTCPREFQYKTFDFFCSLYATFIYDRSTSIVYRNVFCAVCNNVPLERLRCFYGIELYTPHLLSILLSVPNIPDKRTSFISSCGKGKSFVPGYSSCQSTLCRLSSEIHRNGVCLEDKEFSSFYKPTNNGNSSEEKEEQQINISNGSLASVKNDTVCNESWIFIDESGYTPYNNSIEVLGSQNIKEEVIDYIEVEGGYVVCIKTSLISVALNWISFVGLIISIFCLSLHLLTFFLLSSHRNLPGKNLASFSICLLLAFIVFLVSPSVTPETTICYITACLMYFCFFASFCWMNIIAFDTWESFRAVTSKLYLRRGEQKKRFLLYSIYCWSLAGIAVICLVVTDQLNSEGIPQYLHPNLGKRRCWFGHNVSLLLFFVVPLFVFILLNIFFFVTTTWNFLRNKSIPEGNTSSIDRHVFKVHARLAILMSIAWVSGIVAFFVDNEISWFLFIVLTSLQGTFIFIAFTCNRKVWLEICEVLGYSSKSPPTPANKAISLDEDGNQQPYQTPRIELLHVSSFMDAVHQPSRLNP